MPLTPVTTFKNLQLCCDLEAIPFIFSLHSTLNRETILIANKNVCYGCYFPQPHSPSYAEFQQETIVFHQALLSKLALIQSQWTALWNYNMNFIELHVPRQTYVW